MCVSNMLGCFTPVSFGFSVPMFYFYTNVLTFYESIYGKQINV